MDQRATPLVSYRAALSFVIACVSVGITTLTLKKSTLARDQSFSVYNLHTGEGMQAIDPITLDSEPNTNRTTWETVVSPQFHAGLERIEVGCWIPPHSHQTEEIILVYKGRGFVHGENSHKQPLQTGSLVHIRTGITHAFHNTGDEPLWLMWSFPSTTKDDLFKFKQRYYST